MRIGVVEDHVEILNYLTFVLEAAHHTVYPHMSGGSLIDRLFVEHEKSAPPLYDLLLLDLWLPGGPSGMEVLDYVRRVFPAEMLPVVIISSASGNQLAQLSQRYPGVQVVQKPFRLKILLQSIDASRKNCLPLD
jgi:DNA-binding response OmpR family regulator